MKKFFFIIVVAFLASACERNTWYATNLLMGDKWVHREYGVRNDKVYIKTHTLIFNTASDVVYSISSNDPEEETVSVEWTYDFDGDEGFIYQPRASGGMNKMHIEYTDDLETLFWLKKTNPDVIIFDMHREKL